MTIQQIIKLLKEAVKRIEALEQAQIVKESVQVATVAEVPVATQDMAPAPRRERPPKVVEEVTQD